MMSLLSNQSFFAGRILVVDDDQRARDLMVSSLRAAGHDVDPTSNGPETRRLLGRQWYDLIVSNLKLPELDGPSLYSAGTLRWPTGPPQVLLVSALADISGDERLPKIIKARVQAKPLKVRALRRSIRAMLLGERAP
jgi:DNA-binding response OmpR family regulator